jgi:hypothetical protein
MNLGTGYTILSPIDRTALKQYMRVDGHLTASLLSNQYLPWLHRAQDKSAYRPGNNKKTRLFPGALKRHQTTIIWDLSSARRALNIYATRD